MSGDRLMKDAGIGMPDPVATARALAQAGIRPDDLIATAEQATGVPMDELWRALEEIRQGAGLPSVAPPSLQVGTPPRPPAAVVPPAGNLAAAGPLQALTLLLAGAVPQPAPRRNRRGDRSP